MHATSERAQASAAARSWLSVGSLLALHIRDSAGLVGLTSRVVPALAPDRLTALDRSTAAAQWDRSCPEPELVLSSALLRADAPEFASRSSARNSGNWPGPSSRQRSSGPGRTAAPPPRRPSVESTAA